MLDKSMSLDKEFYAMLTNAKFVRLPCTDSHIAEGNQLRHSRKITPIATNLSLGSGFDNFLTRN
jgi:hypothetical protein